jgi:hypothetical protein
MVIEDIYSRHFKGEQLSTEEVSFLFAKLAEKSSPIFIKEKDDSSEELRLLKDKLTKLKKSYVNVTDDKKVHLRKGLTTLMSSKGSPDQFRQLAKMMLDLAEQFYEAVEDIRSLSL